MAPVTPQAYYCRVICFLVDLVANLITLLISFPVIVGGIFFWFCLELARAAARPVGVARYFLDGFFADVRTVFGRPQLPARREGPCAVTTPTPSPLTGKRKRRMSKRP